MHAVVAQSTFRNQNVTETGVTKEARVPTETGIAKETGAITETEVTI